jgi:hypothetical protein
LTVHNFSDILLTQEDISILNKGLSYSITPYYTVKDHLSLLKQFDQFSHTVRNAYQPKRTLQYDYTPPTNLNTAFTFRKMKFLKSRTISAQPYSTPILQSYIYNTKDDLCLQLPKIFKNTTKNVTNKENKALKNLANHYHLTIKPADKNLGIVILNTDDYLDQCLQHLASTTYQLVDSFPNCLLHSLENTVLTFKSEICLHGKILYNFLLPSKKYKYRTPRFYGLPKIHKAPSEKGIPPLRPIVSHTNSLLSSSAKFIDHVLQPLARAYPDYLHSTFLTTTLTTYKYK